MGRRTARGQDRSPVQSGPSSWGTLCGPTVISSHSRPLWAAFLGTCYFPFRWPLNLWPLLTSPTLLPMWDTWLQPFCWVASTGRKPSRVRASSRRLKAGCTLQVYLVCWKWGYLCPTISEWGSLSPWPFLLTLTWEWLQLATLGPTCGSIQAAICAHQCPTPPKSRDPGHICWAVSL